MCIRDSSLTSLAGLLGLSFASGVNLYAAVLVVGLGLRYQLLSGLPAELEPLAHPAVLITAAVMYGAEFFADKIPFVSAIWDSVHTFVRPLGAVVLALTATQRWTLLYLGVLASGVGFFLWNVGATKVAAGTLAVMNNAKVPLGVAVSLLFFGGNADLSRLLASLAVLGAAVWLAQR